MRASTDTIVSAATPPGRGGIGVVRLSGPDVPRIAEAMIGALPTPRVAKLSVFRGAAGEALDRGIALYFPGPASFTGEDVLELQGHGGPTVIALIESAAIHLGARRAEPGEFSERAFLNEKLDLAQAEAIADLVESGTTQAAQAALRSLSGEFSAEVNALALKLTRLRVHVEAAIDFPEEEIDFLADRALADALDACALAFATLQARADAGRVLRDGFRLVLIGAPNAGKSSLMNRLSGEETAIVTDVAGTTRDILRETIDIDGLLVELVDTAGLRDDPGVIEKEGIRRAREAMASADAVLWVQDATAREVPPADIPPGIPVLLVRNKSDLVPPAPCDGVAVSALTGAGLDALRNDIRRLAGHREPGAGTFTARRRHVEALDEAARHFAEGRRALEEARAGELLAEELREAQNALGRITGAVTSDELLGRIFSTFCIGK